MGDGEERRPLRVYGDRASGNCMKVAFTADHLGLSYEWVDVDIMAGGSRTKRFLALNPAGQVPCVELPDGRTLSQSNAIILYLAEGSALLPDEPFARAQVDELLFYEQYSHEPNIAVCRFQKRYLGKRDDELDPARVEKGYQALAYMERRLAGRRYFVGEGLSVADIALVAYTRLAPEGGFDLGAYESVRRWIGVVEEDLGLA